MVQRVTRFAKCNSSGVMEAWIQSPKSHWGQSTWGKVRFPERKPWALIFIKLWWLRLSCKDTLGYWRFQTSRDSYQREQNSRYKSSPSKRMSKAGLNPTGAHTKPCRSKSGIWVSQVVSCYHCFVWPLMCTSAAAARSSRTLDIYEETFSLPRGNR